MERNAIVAALLCLLVLLGYQAAIDYLYPPSPTPIAEEATRGGADRPVVPPGTLPATDIPAGLAEAPLPPAAIEPHVSGNEIAIETDLYSARISSNGGRILSFRLKDFRESVEQDSPPLDMISLAQGSPPPLGMRFQAADGSVVDDTTVAYSTDRDAIELTGDAEATLTLSGQLPGGARVEKILRFRGDAYPIEITVRAPDLSATYPRVGLGWRHAIEGDQPTQEAYYRGAMVLSGKDFEHELTSALIDQPPRSFASPVSWGGYTEHYFMTALVPGDPDEARAVIAGARGNGVEVLVTAPRAEPEGARFTLYVGPKEIGILREIGYGLDRAVDFGWFSILAIPLIRLLNLFHRGTGNYGIDIVLLTILVKVLFIPLTNKSMQSMRAMQKVQPEMTKLREKYKDDREALNKEMIELYRRHKVNPLGGCLPMLLQFPVFIGLYQGLYGAIELRHASFALWIRDLSTNECYPWPGQTTLIGCNDLSIMGLPIPLLVLFMGGSMILQQWLTPSTGMDPTQQRMMMILMPVMFTVMFVTFPSGLVMYWLVNNVLTIGQQWYTNRRPA